MATVEKTRKINTHVKATEENMTIFESITGQIADGIWENNAGMTSYWKDIQFEEKDGNIIVALDPRREICYYDRVWKKYGMVDVPKWRNNRYHGMTDEQVMNFLKNKIRQIVKIEDNDNKEQAECPKELFHQKYFLRETVKQPEREDFSWRKDNETYSSYIDATVGECYEVVKTLGLYSKLIVGEKYKFS